MRLLHIPVLEQLVQITCPPELARKLFAYCLEWGAMIARSGHAASVGNPGGAVWTIRARWTAPGADLTRDTEQLRTWCARSFALGWLSIKQVGELLLTGATTTEIDGTPGGTVVDPEASPRSPEFARDAFDLIVGHAGDHDDCARCTLITKGCWDTLAPTGGRRDGNYTQEDDQAARRAVHAITHPERKSSQSVHGSRRNRRTARATRDASQPMRASGI